MSEEFHSDALMYIMYSTCHFEQGRFFNVDKIPKSVSS